MRPVRARWHDRDHHRSGRTAAGTVGPLHGAPIDPIFAGPRRLTPAKPRCSGDVLPAGAVMPKARTHTTMITLSSPAGQGRRLRTCGTYGHSATPRPAATVPHEAGGRPTAQQCRTYKACEAISLRRHCPGQVLGVAVQPLNLPPVPPGVFSGGARDRLLRSSRRPGLNIPSGGTHLPGHKVLVHREADAADPAGRSCGGHTPGDPAPGGGRLVLPGRRRPPAAVHWLGGGNWQVRPGCPDSRDGGR
jgi:hypothetical protein